MVIKKHLLLISYYSNHYCKGLCNLNKNYVSSVSNTMSNNFILILLDNNASSGNLNIAKVISKIIGFQKIKELSIHNLELNDEA